MSSDNSTSPAFHTVELNTLALDILQDSALDAGDSMAELSLSSLLFGILTMLCFTSIYFLIRQGSTAQIHGRAVLLSIVLLYLSTATYMGALIWEGSSGSQLTSGATVGLFSPTYDGQEMAAFIHSVHQQSWMMTITLAVNILIGDAVVWWRACVCVRTIDLRARLIAPSDSPTVCGVIGMYKSRNIESVQPVFLVATNAYAHASVGLSLGTNVLATSLIAYKAWEHRQLWKQDLIGVRATSQVFKALALLIESGCIYCVLLVIVIVYQSSSTSVAFAGSMLNKIGAYFTYGCLVPLVAIYPTVIIVLVALKRSPIDTGVRQVCAHNSEGGISTTIEFHQSTFYSSAGADTESVAGSEGVTVDGHWGTHLLKASTSEIETKDSADLV
ncbi:hypothetical protein GSI_07343 [Ganoderma sinense ZZ0214-1]|uniref:Uncharacterized protein n=1 Tax=Ganoderma sinense ZZ0214-1 TaxID=1077348 RepID=A0A2G8SA73_9APHY|nr:hypothetical protein GSI_07343 [Ganoderma sinense ZZ0214-1]